MKHQEANMGQSILRGDIYMVDLDKGFGSIQGGRRPCIVVSNNIGNYYSSILIIAPVTTQPKHKLPTHVTVGKESGLLCKSTILYEQIFTISKDQLMNKVAHKNMAEQDDEAIAVALGLYGKGKLKIQEEQNGNSI